MECVALSDKTLIHNLKGLCGDARVRTSKVIAYLAEVERRDLHLKKGYRSLFAFCTRRLKMSEYEAVTRIAAARLLATHGHIVELLERGDVTLTTVYLLQKHLVKGGCDDLIAACKGKGSRQVKQIIAGRFPQPDAPDRIRKLPARACENPAQASRATEVGEAGESWDAAALRTPNHVPSPRPSAAERTDDLFAGATTAPVVAVGVPEAAQHVEVSNSAMQVSPNEAAGVPVRGANTVPAGFHRVSSAAGQAIVPLASDRHKIQFTISTALCEKIERALRLSSHRNRTGDFATMFEQAVDLLLVKLEKERLAKTTRRSRSSVVGASEALEARLACQPPDSSHALAAESTYLAQDGRSTNTEVEQGCSTDSGEDARGSVRASPEKPSSDAPGGIGISLTSPSKKGGEAALFPKGDVAERATDTGIDASSVLAADAEAEGDALSGRPEWHAKGRRRAKRRGAFGREARRAAFLRDGEQCAFIGDDGVRCDARSFLEVDHIEPRALGGQGTATNARVLCAAHNAYEARRRFGRRHVERRIKEKREERGRRVDRSPFNDVEDTHDDLVRTADADVVVPRGSSLVRGDPHLHETGRHSPGNRCERST